MHILLTIWVVWKELRDKLNSNTEHYVQYSNPHSCDVIATDSIVLITSDEELVKWSA